MYNLDDENIIKIYSFNCDKTKEKAVLIMEYADGGDLNRAISEAKFLNGKKLDEFQIISWFEELCKGVKYCHKNNIIHRDLKPENIFLTKDNHVKIGDFGVSKILGRVKVTNTVHGSSDHISPEAYYGKDYTFSTDIWSLGILLYELCLLENPMDKYHLKFKAEYLEGKFPKLKDNEKKYTENMSDLIEKMLNVEPDKRPSLDEIIKECEVIKNLTRYEGETNNGVKEGKGKYFFDNGDIYDGEWKKGKIEGKGIYYYKNGNKYEGEWINGKKEGKGILNYSNGDKYDGEWKGNSKEGKGCYYYKNGNKYEGEWKNNKMEGKGILLYSNGDKFDGEWKDNKKDGNGIYYYTNGATKKGIWSKNEFQKAEV
jgi:serine/threonine protein kinase